MHSKMWQEIQDSCEVSLRFINGDMVPFERFNEELKRSSQLILMGTGASLNACKVAQYAFIKYMGIMPSVVPAADIDELSHLSNSDMTVILVSQSGQSHETQVAVSFLKQRGIKLWGITNIPESVLATNADQLFLMNAGEEFSSATKTYVATLLILFKLAAGRDADFLSELQNVPKDILTSLQKSDEKVLNWSEQLLQHDKFYVLGAHVEGITAQQGALVFKEKTFLHAEGMTLSEFRHGNIEVVQPGLPIIVMATSEKLVGDSLKHAEHLASLGAAIYVITDRAFDSALISDERVIVLPAQTNVYLSQLVSILPLMLLAEQIAAIKGYDIDGFKYISKVVDHY